MEERKWVSRRSETGALFTVYHANRITKNWRFVLQLYQIKMAMFGGDLTFSFLGSLSLSPFSCFPSFLTQGLVNKKYIFSFFLLNFTFLYFYTSSSSRFSLNQLIRTSVIFKSVLLRKCLSKKYKKKKKSYNNVREKKP